ncbi:MAG: glycosyltransferase [Rikenellaceae bacterium]
MTVSVIVPNYKHSAYLVERIESILNQSYRDFELILLDDKSSDSSREVIESYRDNEHVSHIVINEVNSGSTFKQWDLGLSLAKGRYIWIAESDDYADPTFLERCVAQLDANPDAVICYTDSHIVDSNGAATDNHRLYGCFEPRGAEVVVKREGSELLKGAMFHACVIYNASMALFRKDCLSRVDPVYKVFKSCGDWLFWSLMASCGSVIRITEPLNYFRQHGNKVSVNAKREQVALESLYFKVAILFHLYDKESYAELVKSFSPQSLLTETGELYIKLIKESALQYRLKLYAMALAYNTVRRIKENIPSDRYRLYREMLGHFTAPIAGFLIKNSKLLTLYLTKGSHK